MLLTTAQALRWLEDEVVRRLNAGQWYEQIVNEVDLPAEFKDSTYLQPIYGCPVFAVHSILRRYTGWYDGNPSMLFPSPRAEIAAEVVDLAGSPEAVLARARALRAENAPASIQRALHLTDFVILDGRGDVAAARALKAALLVARGEAEPSFVARNILMSAAALERA
jgi:alkyl sulfatase BDS1-like metallo-beta-lactamase superfamily hydrolase